MQFGRVEHAKSTIIVMEKLQENVEIKEEFQLLSICYRTQNVFSLRTPIRL